MVTELRSGTVLGDSYKLVDLLGRGGMGEVWRAQHTRLPKQFAVKVLHGAAAANEVVLARFRREAEIASRLGHASIVEVLDFNTLSDGTPYMVMEMLSGENLRERAARGPMKLPEVNHLLSQVASALHKAHEQGIVHRDLKPDNIFLCQESLGGQTFDRAKVLDFGISKIQGSQTIMTQDAEVLGTPIYMAPEQAAGQQDRIDGRTDQFALGAIAYELLSGQIAFGGQTLVEVVNKIINLMPTPVNEVARDVPAYVAQAINRALSKAPGERFATITDFAEALAGRAAPRQHTVPFSGKIATGPTPASNAASTPGSPGTRGAGGDVPFAETMASQPGGDVGSLPTLHTPAGGPPVASSVGGPPTAGEPLAPAADAPTLRDPPDVAPARRRWSRVALGGSAVLVVLAGAGLLVWMNMFEKGDEATGVGSGAAGGRAVRTDASGATRADADPADRADASRAARADATPPDEAPSPDRSTGSPDAGPNDRSVAPPAKPDAESARHATRTTSGTRKQRGKATLPPELLADLRQAEAALARRDTAEAIRLAQRSMIKKKTSRAYAVMARAYCLQHALGRSKAMLRNLRGAHRRRVVRWCRRAGFDPDPR